MRIGDLFLRVLADDKGFAADLDKKAGKAGDKAGQTLGARMSGGLKKSFSGAKGDLLGLVGLGAGIGIATVAAGKLVDVMGQAVAAAIEEERSIAKLDAALRANVEGYNGNTDAIEKALAARMRLGFADDEQRESLALLVVAYKDETKALEAQRTAMDLARLKGISLKEASEALIKVEAGQFRALKALGIQLPKNATAQEALNAVQKVAKGQAEAYADTTEGKLLASQIKVGEAMEKLGTVLLPLVTEAAEGGADAVEKLVGAFDGLNDVLSNVGSGDPLGDFARGLDVLAYGLTRGGNASGYFAEKMAEAEAAAKEAEQLAETARETGRGLGVMEAAAADAVPPIVEIGEEAGKTATRVDRATGKMITSVKDLRDAAIGAARDIVDKAYQIISDKAELTAVNVEKAELAKVIATGNATREQKARYRELTEAQAGLILDLAENGQENTKVVKTAVAQLREQLKTATGQERKAISATIAALERLEAQYRNTARASRKVNWPSGSGGNVGGTVVGNPHRHSGGPVQANRPYTVGRPGAEELFIPDVSGRIAAIPEIRAAVAGGSSAGGTTNINVQMDAAQAARDPFDVARQLRRLADFGVMRLPDG